MPSPLSLCCKCDHKPKLTTLENGSGDGDPWFTYTCRNCENTSDEYDGTKYEARIRWNDEQEKGRLASGKPGVPPVSAATTQPSMLEQYVLTRAPTREELLNHTSKKWMVKLKAFSQWMEALVQHPSAYSPGEITEADADYLAMFLCDGSGGTMALNPESIEMCYAFNGSPLDPVNVFAGGWLDEIPSPEAATAWWREDKTHAWEIMRDGHIEWRLWLRVGRDGILRRSHFNIKDDPDALYDKATWGVAHKLKMWGPTKWRKIEWSGESWKPCQ